MRRAVSMTMEDAKDAFLSRVADLERENQELRANVARLANENNDLCDRVYDLERIISGQREAAE
jgi:cell division protein FtsB